MWPWKKKRRREEAYARIVALGGVAGGNASTFYGVNFRRRPITDDNLALVAEFPEVDHIDIEASRVTDAGLKSLRGLRSLELLYLADVPIGDEGLVHLAGLRRLKVLDLRGTLVTDKGLTHVAELSQLEILHLARTAVTDFGVPHLKRLTRLQVLTVEPRGLSPSALADLREAIPSLRINPEDDDVAENELAEESLPTCLACDGDLGSDPPNLCDPNAACPHCGECLWSIPAIPDPPPFGKFERMIWAAIAVASMHVIWLNDRSPLAAVLWLLSVLALGQLLLPPVFRWVYDVVNERNWFWLGVVCGWGLVAGLPMGILAGVLVPYFVPCGITSWAGGIIGLLLGPMIAAAEGLILASILCSGVWLVTGKSLARDL